MNNNFKTNRENLNCEIKLYVNQQLFDKNLISEDMYICAKESILKKLG